MTLLKFPSKMHLIAHDFNQKAASVLQLKARLNK